MNILIDIGHPAHVHMFRCFAHEMEARGHKVLFTSRDKEFEIQLLQKEGFDFVNLGKKHTSVIGKSIDLLRFDWKVWCIARRFKADIYLSHGSITASHVAWLMRKVNIAFEDTYNKEQVRLYKPFTKVIFTAKYPNPLADYSKTIAYAGYHELMYLHPNRFTPDPSILEELGIEEGEKYVILRFVAWQASHDRGHKGMSYKNKLEAIKQFSKYAKVFITSEKTLPKEFEPYRIAIHPERMHHAMAYASLLFGESSTMIMEAGVLGVPGIYFNVEGIRYTEDVEKKYQLNFNYPDYSEKSQQDAIAKGVEILQSGEEQVKQNQQNQRRLLYEHIDVTAFLVWFVENYPESKHIMKEKPEYQYRFR